MSPTELAAAINPLVDPEPGFSNKFLRAWAMVRANQSPLAVGILRVLDELDAAVLAERERCAKVAEEGHFLHADAPTARFGREVAAAIRRGP